MLSECHHVVASLLREPSCAPLDPDFDNLLYDTSANGDVCGHSSYECSVPQVFVIFSDSDCESQDATVHPESALLVTALDRIRQGAADSVGTLCILAANLYDRSPLVSFEPFVDESVSSLSSLDASTASRSSSFICTPAPIGASSSTREDPGVDSLVDHIARTREALSRFRLQCNQLILWDQLSAQLVGWIHDQVCSYCTVRRKWLPYQISLDVFWSLPITSDLQLLKYSSTAQGTATFLAPRPRPTMGRGKGLD